MEKYENALKLIETEGVIKDNKNVLESHESSGVLMERYLENLVALKKELLGNMSIASSLIEVFDKSVKECLINIARNSLEVLCILKKISSESIITNNKELFERKNADYGNSFADFALIGVIVRLNDKINRILNLGITTSTDKMKVDEKIEDTINDLYNYCVIGLMYL
tara:strand:- start:1369 stop:1869 length:501 start_codon:yes stop_codon:yes gene_type:complete